MLVSLKAFEVGVWTLCALAAFFLASRLAVRICIQGRLVVSDYVLIPALPILFIALGILQSALSTLYRDESAAPDITDDLSPQTTAATSRITASIELLWIVIYCVKLCFLAQFKFYRPPFAYVNVPLTRYYWTTIVTCGAAFLVTIAEPIVLCPGRGKCRYANQTSHVAWETVVAVLDIVTGLLVISIHAILIHMANHTLAQTVINYIFKSLSIFAIAIAVIRIALQYDATAHRIDYTTLVFLLAAEASIAIIMASISSYRDVVLGYFVGERTRKAEDSCQFRIHPNPRAALGTGTTHAQSATGEGIPMLAHSANSPRFPVP